MSFYISPDYKEPSPGSRPLKRFKRPGRSARTQPSRKPSLSSQQQPQVNHDEKLLKRLEERVQEAEAALQPVEILVSNNQARKENSRAIWEAAQNLYNKTDWSRQKGQLQATDNLRQLYRNYQKYKADEAQLQMEIESKRKLLRDAKANLEREKPRIDHIDLLRQWGLPPEIAASSANLNYPPPVNDEDTAEYQAQKMRYRNPKTWKEY